MLKKHTMYELRISSVGSRYTLEATDMGRADARWEYGSSDDLSGKLSDLGIASTELVIRLPPTGEPQEIVLSDRRFRGSVLADVLGK
jgi:hypothetical protein